MNILMVGDVYGEPGRQAVAKLLPQLRQEHAIDFTVVNMENAAAGFGVTPPIARQAFDRQSTLAFRRGDPRRFAGEVRLP